MNKQNFVSEARFNATQLINELFMLILWLENEQAPKTGIGSSGLVSDLIEVMDLNYGIVRETALLWEKFK